MQALIKDGQRIPRDDWSLYPSNPGAAPSGRVLVPMDLFLSQHQEWATAQADCGVWLGEEDQPETLAPHLNKLTIIALYVPKFADGRAFSKARLLRQRFGYRGEIRLTGDFLPDQVAYYARCGVDAFACRTEEEASVALQVLARVSVHYQTDAQHSALFEWGRLA